MTAAPDDDHCYHHSCDTDNDACAAGDCADEDECVCCPCCCTCLGCQYGPKDGLLMWPNGNAEIERMGTS